MHGNELWQLYYPNGEPIVGVGSNSDDLEERRGDEIVGIAIVILFRKTENGLELLWQKRSDYVSRFPGYYDVSAGGHVDLGETLIEAAIREAHEEIGALITAEDLQFVTMRPFNRNRFTWVYAVDYTDRREEFLFNDREVSEVKWVDYSETEEFKKNFAKPPLKEESLIFECLHDWLKMRGYLSIDE